MNIQKLMLQGDRDVVAAEIRNLRKVRATLLQLRRHTRPDNRSQLMETRMGPVTRAKLLEMAERAFAESIKRVCRARRAMFEKRMEIA